MYPDPDKKSPDLLLKDFPYMTDTARSADRSTHILLPQLPQPAPKRRLFETDFPVSALREKK